MTAQRAPVRLWVIAALLGLVAASLASGAAPANGAVAGTAGNAGPAKVRVLGWGLDGPAAMAVSGGDLFVANENGSFVVELDSTTGELVRLIAGASYGFAGPDALAIAGGDLFVADGNGGNGGGSVTEVDIATGALVRVISGPAYHIGYPTALAVSGGYLVVADYYVDAKAGSLTEVDTSTGALVRVLSAPRYALYGPTTLAAVGPDVFAEDYRSAILTEVDVRTGALVRVVEGYRYGFDGPMGMVPYGRHLFVADGPSAGGGLGGVTELDTATGAFVHYYGSARYGFYPVGMALAGGDLFVANQNRWAPEGTPAYNGYIVEVSASTGALVRRIYGPRYLDDFEFQAIGQDFFPSAMAAAGGRVFVAGAANTITVVDASTVADMEVITGSSYRFSCAGPMASSGAYLFVANGCGTDPEQQQGGGSVTELDATTGALVRVLSAPSYQFQVPIALVASGPDLFVLNQGYDASTEFGGGLVGASITEVDIATGALVRVIPLSYQPTAMAESAGMLFVTQPTKSVFAYANSTFELFELDTSTGAEVRAIGGPGYDLVGPSAVVACGPDLFVTADNSVSELDASTGVLVRVISGARYQLHDPLLLVAAGPNLFIANYGGAVTEIDSATGALVRVIAGAEYGIKDPYAMTFGGGELFVDNNGSGAIIAIDAATGALVRVLSSPAYKLPFAGGLAFDEGGLFVSSGLWLTELYA